MKKSTIYILLTVFALFGCTKKETDPDLASEIKGTYEITYYETQSGVSNISGLDNIVIEKEDNVLANVTIDYANDSLNDVELTNVKLSFANNIYSMEQEYSNATFSGSITADTLLQLQLNYEGGNHATIKGIKK